MGWHFAHCQLGEGGDCSSDGCKPEKCAFWHGFLMGEARVLLSLMGKCCTHLGQYIPTALGNFFRAAGGFEKISRLHKNRGFISCAIWAGVSSRCIKNEAEKTATSSRKGELWRRI